MANQDVAEQKKRAQAEYETARQNVVQLLQQHPSSNFFVRVGIRIRNFFRNLLSYFSFNLFKSSLERALEKLTDAERTLNQAKTAKSKENGFFKNLVSASKQYIKQTDQPSQETNTILASTLEDYINENVSSLPKDLVAELCDYIKLMKLGKNAPDNQEIETAANLRWRKVRAAIDKGGLIDTLELENILFKIKLVYPKTKDFDATVDKKNQRDFIDSSLAMIKSFGGPTTDKQSSTPISGQNSKSDLFTPDKADKISKQIDKLESENFTHKDKLIECLHELLNEIAKKEPNQKTITRNDEFIKNKLPTIKISVEKTSGKNTSIEDITATINRIKSEIYSLKPECEPTAASTSSYKKS